jgi:hypothetical protein
LTAVLAGARDGSSWRAVALAVVWLHVDPALRRHFVQRLYRFRGAAAEAESAYYTALIHVASLWPPDLAPSAVRIAALADAEVRGEAGRWDRWAHWLAPIGDADSPSMDDDSDQPMRSEVRTRAWSRLVAQRAAQAFAVDRRVDADRVLVLLQHFDPKDAKVFLARYRDGETLRSLAETGVSHTMVHKRAQAVLARLRHALGVRDREK